MRFISSLLIIILCVGAFVMVALLYDWICAKTNRVIIGYEGFLRDLLSRGDYVSIKGKVYCFSHITRGGEIIDHILPPFDNNKTMPGELAFDNPNSLGYIVFHESALRNCEFIYGKYGLRWAASKDWAAVAKEKVDEYIWS